MKVLYLTKYTRKGASSRLRSYQYIPHLEKSGIEITVRPLFLDNYLDCLYAGKSTLHIALVSYIKRFFSLFRISQYDYLYIEKELFPYLPAWFEYILLIFKKKYIVDYDDAIFHNYDLHPNPVIRFFLRSKIDKIMRYSNTVIVGNSYLAERAVKAGAENIKIIPTVVDSNRYKKKEQKQKKQVVIGWIGTSSTFKYLQEIKHILKKLIEDYNVLIHIVGANNSLELGENEIYIKWTEDTEVNSILEFDIGIMPLRNSPWEQGKCAYKLIQYMACGIPVVASPVGMNKQLIGEDMGFLPINDSAWYNSLSSYISDISLRKSHGNNGFEMIKTKYSLDKVFPDLYNIISK